MKRFGTAIILAGGKSTRMGFDKQLLKINEKTLIDTTIDKLKSQFDDFIIVSNKPELYINSPYKITSDIFVGKGPIGGIHAGLLLSSTKYAYVIACDMPNINLEYIDFMRGKIKNTKGCITRYENRIEPFNSFYSIELILKIEEYFNGERNDIRGLLEDQDITYISQEEAKVFSPNWEMFKNLNTISDIQDHLYKIK